LKNIIIDLHSNNTLFLLFTILLKISSHKSFIWFFITESSYPSFKIKERKVCCCLMIDVYTLVIGVCS
jgi:hypothetical protein